jgi:outer membrane immunogenic protein
MRTFLIAAIAAVATGQALAADLPAAPPPPPPRAPVAYAPVEAVYNWGGIYLGINGGYGFGSSTWTDPNNPIAAAGGTTGAFNLNGWLIGGTLGANYQINQLVLGLEGDLDWSNIKGNTSNAFCGLTVGAAGPVGTNCQTQNTWLSTVRGRIGIAADRVLFYGTGGVAFGNVQAGLTGGGIGSATYQTQTNVGWTGGAGVEVAFADNWTARLEYLYVSLGSSASCTTISACGADNVGGTVAPNDKVKFTTSMIRLGVDYKFGP